MDLIWPVILFFLFVTAGMIILFAPTRAAYNRKHKNRKAIMYLNLLGGWSFIGWVAAYVWAQTNDVEADGFEIDKREKTNCRDTMIVAGVVYFFFWLVIFAAMRT